MIALIRGAAVMLFGASLAGCAGSLPPPEAQVQIQPQPVAMQSSALISIERFRACLAIEDMTKERLDCYDAIVAPEPKAIRSKAKTIVECRFVKEEDQRLTCFNSFLVERPTAKPPMTATAPALPPPVVRHTPTTTTRYVRKGRGGCGSRGGAGYRLPSGRCASKRR
jgi:hypothetical protein